MPSTPSPNLRLNLQETGEGINVWGLRLNESLLLIEDSLTKVLVKPLTGNVTLSTALYAPDESRSAALIFTDGGLTANPTVTVPAVSKIYYVENRCLNRPVAITAGGSVATIPAMRKGFVVSSGEDCWLFDPVADGEAIVRAIAAQASTSAQAAASAAGTATTRRDQAEAARDAANVARNAAQDSASQAAQSVTDAAGQVARATSEADRGRDQADLRVGWAQEWATKPAGSAVSAAAGGDGSTTFSARHWAAMAAASAQSVDGPAINARIDRNLRFSAAYALTFGRL